MAVAREAIFEALFNRVALLADPNLAGALLFRYSTRIYEAWDELAPSQKPAVQLRRGPESRTNPPGLPPLVNLGAALVIFAQQDESRDVPASIQLNELLTAVEGALERKTTDVPLPGAIFPNNPSFSFGTTLGGLCYGCQIAGVIETFEAPDDGLMGIIPVEILTTPNF